MGRSILFHYSVADEIIAVCHQPASLGIMALMVGMMVGPILGC